MTTITYQRPSGNPITVSDNAANREYATANGWVEVKPAAEKPAAKAKAK